MCGRERERERERKGEKEGRTEGGRENRDSAESFCACVVRCDVLA